jgi:enamine deaminase RidA (YjgF/YER057c/UK114 family)
VATKNALASRFSGKLKPAVSFVLGNLGEASAAVAADCVATTSLRPSPGMVERRSTGKLQRGRAPESRIAILPHGPKVYISGDAKPGKLSDAVTGTMESLGATLKHLGLGREHVVQCKAFMTPISDVALVAEKIGAFFDGQTVPPLVFVEWSSSLPVEIELIAAMPGPLAADIIDTVRYVTPPGVTASPVYSRVAVTRSEKTIYVSGLYGRKSSDSDGQVHELFSQLKGALDKTGSDLNHLVKATYYVANDEVSDRLGKIRPEYYDPKRPPAASKALVRGVGIPGKTITMDMIAVPKNAVPKNSG